MLRKKRYSCKRRVYQDVFFSQSLLTYIFIQGILQQLFFFFHRVSIRSVLHSLIIYWFVFISTSDTAIAFSMRLQTSNMCTHTFVRSMGNILAIHQPHCPISAVYGQYLAPAPNLNIGHTVSHIMSTLVPYFFVSKCGTHISIVWETVWPIFG